MQTFELPWPPSVNHYYRNVQGRIIISKDGREYRDKIAWALRNEGVKKISGDITMTVELYPPDNRRRDMDNVQKALWDALEKGGLYDNDSQIKSFHAEMREPLPPAGIVFITVSERN